MQHIATNVKTWCRVTISRPTIPQKVERIEACWIPGGCSPHLCVGSFFLVLYPARAASSSSAPPLPHTTLSHTLFHTQLCHAQSFTHTHTLAQNCCYEFGCGMHRTCATPAIKWQDECTLDTHTHIYIYIYIYMLSPPPTTPLNPPSASLCLTCVCTEPRWSHQRVDPAAAASLLPSWGLMLLWKLPLRTNR